MFKFEARVHIDMKRDGKVSKYLHGALPGEPVGGTVEGHGSSEFTAWAKQAKPLTRLVATEAGVVWGPPAARSPPQVHIHHQHHFHHHHTQTDQPLISDQLVDRCKISQLDTAYFGYEFAKRR